MTRARESRWWALALLCIAQFMVVLDLAIVNVALPSIQSDLGFSQGSLQWVVSAYAVALAGFVLLGGRAADTLGRRRTLMAGLAVFGVGSLVAGLAWSELALVGARGLQGLGAALVSPAALSLLTTTFREGRDRNVALGVWGAVGGLGGAAGMLLGGVLTATVGWAWVFFVNLPVVASALVLAPLVLPAGGDGRGRRFDGLGAALVTGGLSTAVLALSGAAEHGWTSARTVGTGTLAAALLAGFVVAELRAPDPLVSFGLLRSHWVRGANLASLATAASVSSMFLMMTLYMQRVLGFSPLQAGLAYLVVASSNVGWATVASRLVSRVGPRPVLVTGLVLLSAGLAFFARLPVDATYVRDLLPGFLVVAAGMSFSFVSINVAGLTGLDAADAGLGSGLLGTSQQVGAALGIAILSSIAAAHADAGSRAGEGASAALADGLHAAFATGALVALAGAVLALVLLRSRTSTAAERGPLDEAALPAPA